MKFAIPLVRLSVTHYLLLISVIVLFLIPTAVPYRSNPFFLSVIVAVFLYGFLSQSWNILGGYTGQFSFGHQAFFGIGAYTTAILFTRLGTPPLVGFLVSAGLTSLISLGIGLPSLRLKGPFFVFSTIAFAEILRIFFSGWSFTYAMEGLWYPITEDSWYNLQFHADRTPYYYIALCMMLLSTLIVFLIRRSRSGYYFVAIREDEDAAESVGINTTKYKLLSTAISAALTGIGGAFYAQYILFLLPSDFMSIDMGAKIFLPSIIGGKGTILGPLLGAFLLVTTSEYLRFFLGGRPAINLAVYGALLIIFSISMPAGIIGFLRKHR